MPRPAEPASSASVGPDDVMRALDAVLDPELGMSIVQLGLIYGVRVADDAAHVTMTLTAEGCPIHGLMADWVRAAVLGVPGIRRAEVTVTFDPPWTPDRIRR
jgi:metal-sulfur cluster biosynthetic enzyme